MDDPLCSRQPADANPPQDARARRYYLRRAIRRGETKNMASGSVHPEKAATRIFIPREHGATAMLLTPFFAAAILLRNAYWQEFIALVAITAAFLTKDPLVVIARQRFVWKQEHTETGSARRALTVLGTLLLGCGLALMRTSDWHSWIPFVLGSAGFSAVAVVMTVRNEQRHEWFQVASAAALSSTCLVACLSAIGRIPGWCWLLWIFCTLQAIAGIFVVHARLDARIAARTRVTASTQNRRAAYIAQGVLVAGGIVCAVLQWFWIAAALILTAACYLLELRRQRDPVALQERLQRVGLRALLQSVAYTLIIVVGLWR